MAGLSPEHTSLRIHNDAKEFTLFWNSVQTASIEEKVARFKTEFAPRFWQFYQYKFERWKEEDLDIDSEIAAQLEDFSDISDEFGNRAIRFEVDIQKNLKSFLYGFPDFNSDIDIYVTHSLGEMDGGTRQIGGKSFFIFGIEGIVKYHKSTTDIPFFHHELFHVYHDQHFAGPDQIWTSLWREGLATYVSSRLNPSSKLGDLMLDIPSGLVARCNQRIQELWCALNLVLKSAAEEQYKTFFLLSSRHPWIPKRAGYYLGFLIAKDIGDSMALPELAKLSGSALFTLIQQTISKQINACALQKGR